MTARYSHASAVPVTKSGQPQRFQVGILVKGTIDGEVTLPAPSDWVAKELAFFRGNFVAKQVTLAAGIRLTAISVYSPAWRGSTPPGCN